MTILYYTATGNSLYVARSLGGEQQSIPQLMKAGTFEIHDDAIGLVCPTYMWRMPKMVIEFLRRATLKAEYLFYIGTFGMMQGASLRHAEKIFKAKGLKLDYTAGILMVDNHLPGFDMEKEIAAAPGKQIDKQIAQVADDIEHRRHYLQSTGLGARIATSINNLFINYEMRPTIAQTYTLDDTCIGCGICTKVCPVGNITLQDKHPVFDQHCERCFACLHNCPKKALHIPSEKSAARFRNEHISLKDIIAANSQE